MKRILVTGATGLLGSSLVPVLAARGHEVIPLARGAAGRVSVDLTDGGGTWRALESIAPDVIINLAALTNVDECERQPQLAYYVNARAVEHIANWMSSRRESCHLVQISTDQVYDGEGPHPEERLSIVNYYAFSKYAGELIAARVDATVLRTNLFGRSRCPGRTSISDWLVTAMRLGQPVRVFEDVLFSPLSLTTLAEMIAVVAERRITGVFNLGSREGMSKAEFAFSLARRLELPHSNLARAASSDVALVARRPNDMRMDSARFESSFGVALPTLESEINLMKDVYAAHA